MAAIGEIGLANVAGALAALFDGQTPDEFARAVDEFLDGYRHTTLGTGLDGVIYQPMLELLDELRAHDFTIGIVTGGGTEFVRQVSKRCYGVEPGMVVGTLIGYSVRSRRTRPTGGAAYHLADRQRQRRRRQDRAHPVPDRQTSTARGGELRWGPRDAGVGRTLTQAAVSPYSSTTTMRSASSPTSARLPRSRKTNRSRRSANGSDG